MQSLVFREITSTRESSCWKLPSVLVGMIASRQTREIQTKFEFNFSLYLLILLCIVVNLRPLEKNINFNSHAHKKEVRVIAK